MAVSITVPDEYGYVVCVLFLAYAAFFFLAEMVVYARKKFDVPYPTMYSEKSKQFNCYQRGHQNALESLPFFLVFTLLGGLQHPLVVSVAGVVWCVGRIVYALGYYSGDASKRAPGAILAFLALVAIFGCSVSLALHMLDIL
ncbi:Microsomal glutathione S-transferase 3 [Holothuria leucospilota]|uniref:Glutathione S-transferase 3, mitochondrial n=1 Tax=Holothuria leucospilota TaxID=206669 RepID=A0A9Q0YRF2_HOLLE|nr:Microsomal glutathione S-transferase 3 [Holothuria leucospilota]